MKWGETRHHVGYNLLLRRGYATECQVCSGVAGNLLAGTCPWHTLPRHLCCPMGLLRSVNTLLKQHRPKGPGLYGNKHPGFRPHRGPSLFFDRGAFRRKSKAGFSKMNSSIFPPPYSGNQIFPYVTHLRGEFFENKFSELFFFSNGFWKMRDTIFLTTYLHSIPLSILIPCITRKTNKIAVKFFSCATCTITAQCQAEYIFCATNNKISIILYHISVFCCEGCAF